MIEIIEGVLHVESWIQVVVIGLLLAFLIARQWLDSRKLNTVQKVTEQAANEAAVASAAAGKVAEDVALVAHEVQNNSGKSLRDVADRTETNTSDVLTAVQAVSDKLDAHLSVAVEESATLAEVKSTTDQLREKFLDQP